MNTFPGSLGFHCPYPVKFKLSFVCTECLYGGLTEVSVFFVDMYCFEQTDSFISDLKFFSFKFQQLSARRFLQWFMKLVKFVLLFSGSFKIHRKLKQHIQYTAVH